MTIKKTKAVFGKGILSLCLCSTYAYGIDSSDAPVKELERMVVTASDQLLDEVVQPITILDQEALQQASGSTLGEMLESLPGISNASFGSGVGRPVIRGLSGNRVKIAVNGNDAADVSAMSNDHAPMAEAANAEQVEVIYGPGTLLFGSGAIGGVINLVDQRIHQVPLVDDAGNAIWKAQISQSISSVNSGAETSGSIDLGIGQNWVFHLDAFARETKNYDSPEGTVLNTQTEGKGFSTGLSHIRSDGHSALALSVLDYDYGVPNADDEDANVSPYQVRLDGEYEKILNSTLLESFKLQMSVNDYEHEEGTDGTVVGYFEKQNIEFKGVAVLNHDWIAQSKLGVHINWQELALCHDHSGCESGIPDYSYLSWDGTKGGNFTDVVDGDTTIEFAHDTPMPRTSTLDTAGFWIFSGDWSKGKKEFAVRADHRVIQLDPVSVRPASREDESYYDDQTFLALTASSGWTWLADKQKYGLSLARTERAPQADEMFWNGDHHATFSYQLDNPDLEKEIAYTLDVTWQYVAENYQVDAAIYYYDFDGFIYNELQTVKDPFHGNDVYQFVQEDAYLTGFELMLQYELTKAITVTTSLDQATARLKEGVNKSLPRIPPMSALFGLAWQQGPWVVKGNAHLYSKQDNVGENESATNAYETVNAFIGYGWQMDSYQVDVHLKANNLTDELGRNHVSYLKEISPVPGRNLDLGVKFTF
jgi:iron complex outermembrane receptor protein